tara:strand:- start:179 stop:1303 length:1125 start_codon:yes stop_codon:yes gene_type:complete
MSYLGKTQLKASDIRRYNATSSTSATHTLTWTPPNEQSLIVTINGVKQHEDSYSVATNVVTLTSALVSSDKLEIIGIVDIGQTIVPGTGVILDEHVNASAAIAKTKLASLDIVNADVNASAAIALSKLATDPSNASNLASGTVPTARLGSGTASSSTILYGDSAWAAAPSSGLNSVQTFTSSGTWTRPSGITKVIMEVQGAGAGGTHDYDQKWVRNGGGGGYAKKFLDVSSISTSTITVGAAGAGIASAGTPTAGGDSSWADGTNTITGGGSPASSASRHDTGFRGKEGGTSTGGDINISGGQSFSAYTDAGSWGDSVLGTCGYGTSGNTSYQPATSFMDGKGYGGGGGGRISSSASPLSGAGSDGIVIVWEYK